VFLDMVLGLVRTRRSPAHDHPLAVSGQTYVLWTGGFSPSSDVPEHCGNVEPDRPLPNGPLFSDDSKQVADPEKHAGACAAAPGYSPTIEYRVSTVASSMVSRGARIASAVRRARARSCNPWLGRQHESGSYEQPVCLRFRLELPDAKLKLGEPPPLLVDCLKQATHRERLIVPSGIGTRDPAANHGLVRVRVQRPLGVHRRSGYEPVRFKPVFDRQCAKIHRCVRCHVHPVTSIFRRCRAQKGLYSSDSDFPGRARRP